MLPERDARDGLVRENAPCSPVFLITGFFVGEHEFTTKSTKENNRTKERNKKERKIIMIGPFSLTSDITANRESNA
jgi:hypothetical protein